LPLNEGEGDPLVALGDAVSDNSFESVTFGVTDLVGEACCVGDDVRDGDGVWPVLLVVLSALMDRVMDVLALVDRDDDMSSVGV
jgi:hypothetical protein